MGRERAKRVADVEQAAQSGPSRIKWDSRAFLHLAAALVPLATGMAAEDNAERQVLMWFFLSLTVIFAVVLRQLGPEWFTTYAGLVVVILGYGARTIYRLSRVAN